MKRFAAHTLLITVMLLFAGPETSAQNANSSNNSDNSTNSMGIKSLGGPGGYYFQDPTGLTVAFEGLSFEGSIDKEKYTLAPNDVLTVQIESSQNLLFRGLTVNVSGEIILPSIGPVSVSSMTLAQAEQKIEELSKNEYRNPKVTLSVEIPHPVSVHINGAVPAPGKYVLPAQSRLDLALTLATQPGSGAGEAELARRGAEMDLTLATQPGSGAGGGKNALPGVFEDNSHYSYRNIRISHKDGTHTDADLIGYFRGGNLEVNPFLRDGDQVLVKRNTAYSPTVSISGAVKNGAEIEYKPGDTPAALLAISGGFDINADTSRIFLYRNTENGNAPQILSAETWPAFTLEPNDRLVVPYDRTRIKAASAWVLGEIQIPGNFPVISGVTTARELLDLSGGLTEHALSGGAYLIRGTDLENELPNKFNAEMMLRTSDQLLEGMEYLKQDMQLTRNKVSLNLDDTGQLSRLKIFDGDRLFVPRDEQTVFVFGQVNNPGYFPFTATEMISVSDYISKAGGFALAADTERIFILKAESGTWYKPNETKLESGDRIFVDRLPQESLASIRSYEFQKEQLKNQRVQLWLTGISVITGILTTYVAITR